MNMQPSSTTNGDAPRSRTLEVDYLSRVEGEGALYVKIRGDRVEDVALRIFEPPRFFEAFLQGRAYTEAPDVTARICGICPVAYQMSASQAMEDIAGVTVDGPLRDLRHLLYCGEWIESHALHVYMLHAPDFLGYQDAIQMARDHGALVHQGLRLKKLGNTIMARLGGREIHPINPRVGGFYRVPTRAELDALVDEIRWARQAAIDTVRFAATLPFPDFEQDYEFIALRHPAEYAILGGRLVSNRGLDVPLSGFLDHVYEEHVERSTSLHAATKDGGAYLVGPLARYSLNFDRLAPAAQEAARAAGLEETCRNPFKSIVVRSVELVHACETALALIDRYAPPERPSVDVPPTAGTGYGCTEAPRGLCWHQYTTDAGGLIRHARIIPPTSQNQKRMEEDLRAFVQAHLSLSDDELQWKCEQGIRNYDPCISCSCHFLELHLDRE